MIAHWSELKWTDFSAPRMAQAIAVLPVAAIEQHGPHLPLGTDQMIMEGYLARLRAMTAHTPDVLILPGLSVGTSNEHTDFAGTLTLQPATLLAAIADLGASVVRAGCRKLVLLNSHGGNSAALEIAALELRRQHAMLAVCASWSRLGYPAGLFSAGEIRHGIHGGEIETSLMLAFRPELVAMERAGNFVPSSVAMADEFKWLNAGRPAGFGWMAQDLSVHGAMGDASAASAAKGEAAADFGVKAFAELLRDIAAFDLTRLRAPPEHSGRG
ncbi:MAG: creatininase family protein [Alphaproteobacteria bacterium]|nr:creatininase family protein [Alphaproteobacteria bacterium]